MNEFYPQFIFCERGLLRNRKFVNLTTNNFDYDNVRSRHFIGTISSVLQQSNYELPRLPIVFFFLNLGMIRVLRHNICYEKNNQLLTVKRNCVTHQTNIGYIYFLTLI